MPSEAWRSENKVFTKTTKSVAQLAKAWAHVPPHFGTKTCLTKPLSHREVVPATGSKQQGAIPQHKACCLPSAPDAAGGTCSREGSQIFRQYPLQNGVKFPLICKNRGWVKTKKKRWSKPGCAYLPGDCVGQKGERNTRVSLSPVLTGVTGGRWAGARGPFSAMTVAGNRAASLPAGL